MLSHNNAVLIAVDIQGNLFEAMHAKEKLLANALKVVKGAKVFNIPLIVTEQIPDKLGKTTSAFASELGNAEIISKESFSCWGEKKFQKKLESFNRKKAILLGIECHVCVYQTAIDLLENGYGVHVVADAVSSRTPENRKAGLAAMKSAGACLTSTEMIIFELLRTASDARFKEIYKIVK